MRHVDQLLAELTAARTRRAALQRRRVRQVVSIVFIWVLWTYRMVTTTTHDWRYWAALAVLLVFSAGLAWLLATDGREVL